MPVRLRSLLRLDSAAGLAVGTAVLALHRPLARAYGLPRRLVGAMGAASVAYGTVSGRLAWHPAPSPKAVEALGLANAAWAGVCVGIAGARGRTLTPLGRAALLAEAAFVGGLGLLERLEQRRERGEAEQRVEGGNGAGRSSGVRRSSGAGRSSGVRRAARRRGGRAGWPWPPPSA